MREIYETHVRDILVRCKSHGVFAFNVSESFVRIDRIYKHYYEYKKRSVIINSFGVGFVVGIVFSIIISLL